MRLKTLFRSQSDWVILTLIVLGVCAATVGMFALLRSDYTESNNLPRLHTYEPKGLYEIVPPDPKYPPPTGEQRNFSVIYEAGDIYYTLSWSVRNIDRKPEVGKHVFTVELYNSRNSTVTTDEVTSKAIGIGCTGSVTSPSYTLGAYEKKQVQFQVDPSCMYLSTADGKYFWRIY
jgi:hypothetical protein